MNLLRRLPALFRPLTPLELATRQLARAEGDLLETASWREQYAANEQMLRGRIARLRSYIQTATTDESSSS